MPKSVFTIDTGTDRVRVEGSTPRGAAMRYLNKQRYYLRRARDSSQAQKMFSSLPRRISVSRGKLVRLFDVLWEQVGTGTLAGVKYAFSLTNAEEDTAANRRPPRGLSVLTRRLFHAR